MSSGNTGIIRVDQDSLNKLRKTLEDSGVSYKRNLLRLQSLMEEITSGDIQGTPAADLLNKYQQKESLFQEIVKTIEDAEEYTGVKSSKFSDMLNNLKTGMK